MMSNGVAEPTADEIKAFHRKFVTGVTIVTTSQGHEPRGLALNAFTSVTVSPAMVLVCVAKSSTTHDALFAADHFAVNLLSGNQLDIAGDSRPSRQTSSANWTGTMAITAVPSSTTAARTWKPRSRCGFEHPRIPCSSDEYSTPTAAGPHHLSTWVPSSSTEPSFNPCPADAGPSCTRAYVRSLGTVTVQ